jgi:hypothetical protein
MFPNAVGVGLSLSEIAPSGEHPANKPRRSARMGKKVFREDIVIIYSFFNHLGLVGDFGLSGDPTGAAKLIPDKLLYQQMIPALVLVRPGLLR